VAWCLEVHDLVLSKCAAGRDRDWEYAAEALKAELVDLDVLLSRVADLPVPADQRAQIERMLQSIFPTQLR
jgi:hypothetical protein